MGTVDLPAAVWSACTSCEALGVAKKLPLVGLTEIAMRAGVQKPAVAMWRTRYADTEHPFPEEVADLHAGVVFWWPSVKTWLIATGRRWDAGWTLEQVNPQRLTRKFPKAHPTGGSDESSTRTVA
jgi:hypothetical protein